ncbi:hypothetical protein Barb4_05354 [Bacteroidales bacterium Barb4]|nr:hypothetical protein Barb4_05354 [Bacteroidales bacterium Barb4]
MPEQTVVSFCRKGFRFGLQMFFCGYDALLARFPVITCHPVHVMVFYFVPKLSGRLTASVSGDKIRELFSRSLNGNPYPTTVFFEPVHECISSTSTISASLFSKLSACVSFPNFLIRFKAETLLTPNSLPIERKPEPSRYRRRACFFIESGLAEPYNYIRSLCIYNVVCLWQHPILSFFRCCIWDNSYSFFLQI